MAARACRVKSGRAHPCGAIKLNSKWPPAEREVVFSGSAPSIEEARGLIQRFRALAGAPIPGRRVALLAANSGTVYVETPDQPQYLVNGWLLTKP